MSVVIPISLPFVNVEFQRVIYEDGADSHRIRISLPPACCGVVELPDEMFSEKWLAMIDGTKKGLL